MPGSRALPLPNDWDRTAGAPGARREERGRIRGRRPPAEVVEELEFPEAVGNELTLRRALATLAEKHQPARARRPLRPKLHFRHARRRSLAPDAVPRSRGSRPDPDRARPKIAELLAPVRRCLELVELTEETGRQLELVKTEGAELQNRLREGLQAGEGLHRRGAVATVVEVAPWSRIPEARALVPWTAKRPPARCPLCQSALWRRRTPC